MDNNVKIALVQFQSKLNCPDENVEKACGMIAQAASQGAKIVCFPELFSTGYNLDIVGPAASGDRRAPGWSPYR